MAKNKFNLIKFSLKRQKLFFTLALILSAFSVIYALIYCTNLVYLKNYTDVNDFLLYVRGSELYSAVQPFNRTLLLLGFIQLGICGACFIFFSQKRRVYYIGNYVSGIGYAVISVGLSIYNLIFNIIYMIKFYQIDFDAYWTAHENFKYGYSASPIFFLLGIILALSTIFVCVCLGAILYGKFKQAKTERQEKEVKLKEGTANA